MKRIETVIYFDRKPIAKVICKSPFTKIDLEGEEINLPDEYEIKLITSKETKIINKEKDPINYVAFLYQYYHGDYMWAGASEIFN